MPELAEIKIMSDYINHHSKKRKFTKLYHVEKGNNPIDSELIEDFEVIANSFGKELQLKTKNDTKELDFSVFKEINVFIVKDDQALVLAI